jgi:hypothetical protein
MDYNYYNGMCSGRSTISNWHLESLLLPKPSEQVSSQLSHVYEAVDLMRCIHHHEHCCSRVQDVVRNSSLSGQ